MKIGARDLLFLGVVVGGAGVLGAGALSPTMARRARPQPQSVQRPGIDADLESVVSLVDTEFHRKWSEQKVVKATPAPDLAVMRRLSLSLCGTVPSLEEIRRFEARPAEGRIEAWLDDLLRDRRTADYLAERFARAFVGTEDGPFLLYRRRRFIAWLSDAILNDRPYGELVREMIADKGLWTDHPATNFVSVTFDPELGRPTPERLAARVARAFLGARIDCAQCHDHPFQPWKQSDFRGLASFFGGARSDLRGIRDAENEYKPPDKKTKEPVPVAPCVPFRPELRPQAASPRQELAAWIIDPGNVNFARATVNRVWAIMFGRPLAEPIDDLAAAGELHPALLRLAEDFAAHRYDLHRLIRLLARLEVFRLDSTTDLSPSDGDESWAVFPITRLRPEQVAGGLFQASSLTTLGPSSHWFIRLVTYTGRNDFVRRYGDTGEDEFDSRGGTIPQRLLLSNGEIVRERLKDELFNSPTRLASLAPGDRQAIAGAYLAVLTRRPTPEEEAHFSARLAGTTGKERIQRLIDLYWALLNSTEFSWSH
jgi:Protein of unknown function (DUF1549)/Protein of unknown function (DUF1553)